MQNYINSVKGKLKGGIENLETIISAINIETFFAAFYVLLLLLAQYVIFSPDFSLLLPPLAHDQIGIQCFCHGFRQSVSSA